MSITLATFVHHFKTRVTENANRLYQDNHVRIIKQDLLIWQAEVNDLKPYKVSVRIADNELTDIFCTCQPGTCAHVLAVLLLLEKQMGTGIMVNEKLIPVVPVQVKPDVQVPKIPSTHSVSTISVRSRKASPIIKIRQQATEFFDALRMGVADQVKENPDAFTHRYTIDKWDDEKKRVAKANMEGWLPVIFPEYATWHIPTVIQVSESYHYHHHCWTINKSPSPLPCFYPQFEGIPIQQQFWEAMVSPCTQFLVRIPEQSHWVKFKRVAAWWEKMSSRIIAGEFDEFLILEEDVASHRPKDLLAYDWLDHKHYNRRDNMGWTSDDE